MNTNQKTLEIMKKKLLIVIIMIGFTSLTFAQTTSDIGKILNTCIVKDGLLTDVQQNSNTNLIFTMESNLVDLSNYQETLPESFNINPTFTTKERLTKKQIENYYQWVFDFSSDKLLIVMVVKYEKSKKDILWTYRVEKTIDNWVVKQKLQY